MESHWFISLMGYSGGHCQGEMFCSDCSTTAMGVLHQPTARGGPLYTAELQEPGVLSPTAWKDLKCCDMTCSICGSRPGNHGKGQECALLEAQCWHECTSWNSLPFLFLCKCPEPGQDIHVRIGKSKAWFSSDTTIHLLYSHLISFLLEPDHKTFALVLSTPCL